MAFDKAGLSLIGGGDKAAGRMWNYVTLDAATVVRVADYFLDAVDVMKIGDSIWSHEVTGTINEPTALTALTHHVVVSRTATAIDVSDGVAVTLTDTD